MDRIEKIFNFWTLSIFNLLTIVAVELVGGGRWFFDSGAIHALALFFIFLAATRIFGHRYVYDAFLEKFVHAAVAAYIIFSLSHLVEFLSYGVLGLPADISFANVANYYIISLLIVSLGAEHFLRVHDRRGAGQKLALAIGLAPFAAASIVLFTPYSAWMSLEPRGPILYIYLAGTLVAGAVAWIKVGRVGRLVTIARRFNRYLRAAIVMVALSVLPNIFYDVLEDWNIPPHQIIYWSHFLFYFSMSLMFLAFSTVRLSGLYTDVEASTTAIDR